MQKYRPLTLFLILLASSPVWGLDQIFLEPISPVSPVLKAEGGASTSNAEGWDALFVNPAAYATDTVSLTFLDIGGALYMPLSGLSQLLNDSSELSSFNPLDSNNPITSLFNSLLAEGTLGAKTSLGVGWVGRNLGTGVMVEDQVIAKSALPATTLTIQHSVAGVIGMAWPIDVGLGTLKLGAALRPEEISLFNPQLTDVISNGASLSSYTVAAGFGLGWDLGARWDYGPFKTGLVIRDIGSTIINFQNFSGTQWSMGLGFPSNGSTTGTTLYRIPTVIGLGGTWTPDVGSLAPVVQPSLTADFQIPIMDQYTQPSFWTWTHLGGEVRFLQFLTVRAGLNQGYFTFGLGVKMLVVDFNLAVYTDELGRYSGLSPRSSLATELAFHL